MGKSQKPISVKVIFNKIFFEKNETVVAENYSQIPFFSYPDKRVMINAS